MRCPFS